MTDEREERLEQLRNLRENNEAYSYNFDRSHTVEELQELDEGNEDELPEDEFSTAGRVMEIRDFGELVFLDLRGEREEIQIIVRDDEELLEEVESLYRGDIIGVEGTLTYTDKGEFSLMSQDLEVLSRGIRHVPKEHFGVEDEELQYRNRALHLITDMDARDTFRTRSQIISEIRDFLEDREFMEVETPTIQPVYGGAAAEPFTTHVNALDQEHYLNISPELYLKRLIIGGYERIFEITKNFRNESIDTTHNPEFTMMEIYQAYADYEDMMELMEQLYEQVAIEATGSAEVEYQGDTLDFSAPWPRMTMREAIQEYGGFDVQELSDEEIQERMEEHGAELDSDYERGLAIAELFEEEQRRQEEGDDEAHPIDMDFVEALELGMPPTGGLGIGIGRMVMLMTDQESIRDVLLFPMMK